MYQRGTVMRLHSMNGRGSQINWGKYAGKFVKDILEIDREYLIWCYFNLIKARMDKDLCDELGLDSGIAFHKRKEKYKESHPKYCK